VVASAATGLPAEELLGRSFAVVRDGLCYLALETFR
jgi:hypothetical protein